MSYSNVQTGAFALVGKTTRANYYQLKMDIKKLVVDEVQRLKQNKEKCRFYVFYKKDKFVSGLSCHWTLPKPDKKGL